MGKGRELIKEREEWKIRREGMRGEKGWVDREDIVFGPFGSKCDGLFFCHVEFIMSEEWLQGLDGSAMRD